MTKLFSNLILLLLLTLALWSCNNDEPSSPAVTATLTVGKAKEWYENFVMKNKLLNPMKAKIAGSTTDTLQPLLNWDIAELDNDSMWSVVELPWEYKDGEVQIANEEVSEYASLQNDRSVIKQVLRLVILQNRKTGDTYGFKMVVVPELDYMLRKDDAIGENKYLQRAADLSGTVLFYSLQDEFVNGWKYQNGKITGQLKKYKTDQKSNGFKSSNGLETYMVTKCNFYKTEMGNYVSYGSDCYNSYYLVIDFANDVEAELKNGDYNTKYNYGGEETIVYDCFGVPGGYAYTDDCGDCVGGSTGSIACNPCIEINNDLASIYQEYQSDFFSVKKKAATEFYTGPCCGAGYIQDSNGNCILFSSISTTNTYGINTYTITTKNLYTHDEALNYFIRERNVNNTAGSYGLVFPAGGVISGALLDKIKKFNIKWGGKAAGFACVAVLAYWEMLFQRQESIYQGLHDKFAYTQYSGLGLYEITTQTTMISPNGYTNTTTQKTYYTTDGCLFQQIFY